MGRRILFISPAYGADYELRYLPSWQGNRMAPLGILSIIGYLGAKGHDVHLLDARELVIRHRTDKILPHILREITAVRPDVIGLQLITAHFDEIKAIARSAKDKYPNIHLVAGGPHPSVEPELTLKQIDSLDSVCVGPGEEVCLEIAEGNSFKGIAGLMLRGSESELTKQNVVREIDKYPFPYQAIPNVSFYSGYSAYSVSNWLCKSLSIVTSRGCPHSCRFCSNDWSRPFRFHSVEYVDELVKFLARFNIDTINFRDDTIGTRRDRLLSICEKLRESRLFLPRGRLRWRALLRTDQVDPDLLAAMKSAGCIDVAVGMESGTNRILGVMDKRVTVEQNLRAMSYILEAGLQTGTNFIIGLPTETEEEMLKTISFMDELEFNAKGLCSFRPVPGSRFYRDFLESGVLDKEKIDWRSLGDWSIPPEQSFAEVSLERLRELTEMGRSRSFGKQRVSIYRDVADECPDVVDEVARHVGAQIVPLPGTGGEPRFVEVPKDPEPYRFGTKMRSLLNHFPRTKALLRKLVRRGGSTVSKAS